MLRVWMAGKGGARKRVSGPGTNALGIFALFIYFFSTLPPPPLVYTCDVIASPLQSYTFKNIYMSVYTHVR